jgi:hypothetical protein
LVAVAVAVAVAVGEPVALVNGVQARRRQSRKPPRAHPDRSLR